MSTYNPEAKSIKYQEVKATNFELHKEFANDKDYNVYLHGLKTIINVPLIEFKNAFPQLKMLKKVVCLPEFKQICVKFANRYDMFIIKYLHQIHSLYNKNIDLYDEKIREYEKHLEKSCETEKMASIKEIVYNSDIDEDEDEYENEDEDILIKVYDYDNKSKSQLIKLLKERDSEIAKLKTQIRRIKS